VDAACTKQILNTDWWHLQYQYRRFCYSCSASGHSVNQSTAGDFVHTRDRSLVRQVVAPSSKQQQHLILFNVIMVVILGRFNGA